MGRSQPHNPSSRNASISLKRAQSVSHIHTKKRVAEVEDTSNEAYFHRHYRAEAREKLFYEQLFDQRLKQQQILEQKAKKKKKKKECKNEDAEMEMEEESESGGEEEDEDAK